MDILILLKVIIFTTSFIALIIVAFVYSCVFDHLENKDKAIAVISILLLLLICVCTKV
jgi:uncharacterized membrane protein